MTRLLAVATLPLFGALACAGAPASPSRTYSSCVTFELEREIVHLACGESENGPSCDGDAILRARNCGVGLLWVQHVTESRSSDGATVHHPTHGRLVAPGEAFVHRVWATAPGAVTVSISLHVGRREPIEAGRLTFVDDGLEAATTECAAAGGSIVPGGIFGRLFCDRPTSDAGRPCIGEGECETDCVWGGLPDGALDASPADLDRIAFAPWCERVRLAVGRCHDRSSPFGCRPRIERPSASCASRGEPRVPMSCSD